MYIFESNLETRRRMYQCNTKVRKNASLTINFQNISRRTSDQLQHSAAPTGNWRIFCQLIILAERSTIRASSWEKPTQNYAIRICLHIDLVFTEWRVRTQKSEDDHDSRAYQKINYGKVRSANLNMYLSTCLISEYVCK